MKKTVLCILDGVGLIDKEYGNAFKQANTPNFDYLWNNYPHTKLHASGLEVGIPDGQMGSSEVGHTNLGAGRIVYQYFVRINNAIEDGSFFKNEALIGAINNCKEKNSNLHICGNLSDGGVHSHMDHLLAILDLCKKEDFDRVYIHVLLDGRDTLPKACMPFIEKLNNKMNSLGIGTIATVGGRYYCMNRDRDWKLTIKAYNAIVDGESEYSANTIIDAVKNGYDAGLNDEFINPTIIKKTPITNNDSLILFNFRSDRMIQPIRLLTDPNFKEIERKTFLKDLYITTMTEYEYLDYEKKVHVAFKPIPISNSIGEYLSKLGLKQLRLSEAEKRGHVTFYFSGCNDFIYEGEDRVIYDKDDVFTYDEKPSMRSTEITNTLIDAINNKDYSLIVVNYPNGDALGHTGVFDKVIEGLEDLDKCLGRVINETNLEDYNLIIVADHGNCEIMLEDDGTPNKSHTTSLVPFILVNKSYKVKNIIGKLGNVAPTILDLMGIEIPKEMTCESLINHD